MIWLYVLLAIVALILFLLFMNVHLIFRYEDHPTVTLRILFIRMNAIKLFRRFTDEKDGQKTQGTANEKQNKVRKKGSLPGFIEFLARIARVISLAVKEHFSKMKVNLKMLHVSVGTDDAAKTALLCGGAIQAANILCELLRRFSHFRCDNSQLSISPDFTSEVSRFAVHLDLSAKPIHIIGVIVRSYMRFFEREDMNHARNTTQTGH